MPEPTNEFHTTIPDVDNITEAPNPVDPIYSRQQALNLYHPSVILVGCGGVGCWVALSLVLGGVEVINLFDGDTLSPHNLNRFPLPMSAVGEMKSVALAKWLANLRPKAEIVARGEFDPLIHTTQASWVICATDSLKSRRMCHTYAGNIGAFYLEVGADGERWTLSPAPPEFSTELEERAGYQSVPVHVGPCMMAGAAVAYYVLHEVISTASHSGNWVNGIGRLNLETVPEADYGPIVTCRHCSSFAVYRSTGLIAMIKHVMEYSNLGLAEAKTIVDKWFAETPIPDMEYLAEDPDALDDDLDDDRVEEVEDGQEV